MKNKKDERFPAIFLRFAQDKLRERFLFRAFSRVSRVTIFLFLFAFSAQAQGPAWWSERGAVETNLQANDYASITLGQLKWFATNACDEMNAYFGAGSNVMSVVSSFANANNYYSANLGQLKYVAQPFYDRLYELSLTNTFPANMPGYYPWGNASETNDYASANIGQAKYVFSFDSAKDTDGDDLSDWEEIVYDTNPYDPDSDDDGLDDKWEIDNGLDPLDSDTDDDGLSDGYEVDHGTDPLDDSDRNEDAIINEAQEARQRIIRHWQLIYGTTPVFTNYPGSPEDVLDLNNALNALSGKFYKVE